MNKNVEADDDSGWNAYFSLLCNINEKTNEKQKKLQAADS